MIVGAAAIEMPHARPTDALERAVPAAVRATPTRLQSLTSLRFCAAACIVISHVQGSLAVSRIWAYPFALEQGVAFFFVLSGFNLTYVYPTLDGRRIPRFIVSRFARIWPTNIQ